MPGQPTLDHARQLELDFDLGVVLVELLFLEVLVHLLNQVLDFVPQLVLERFVLELDEEVDVLLHRPVVGVFLALLLVRDEALRGQLARAEADAHEHVWSAHR